VTVRNLEFLFRPRSIAVVGGTGEPGSYGAVLLANLRAGGYAGEVFPVALPQPSLFRAAGDPLAALPQVPELAILCSADETLPVLVERLGAAGARAVILTCPLPGEQVRSALLAAARPRLMRVLGPASAGLMVPALRLNASFGHVLAAPGRIALVSQSAAVIAGVLDWAHARGIGFSCLLHLGESADVDLADVLDYLASDPATGSILLHFETVVNGAKFMSAARAAARNKPVVAIRPGCLGEGSRIAATLAGALAEPDDIYAAAMRRAGLVRVVTTEGLFEGLEAVALARPMAADRLAIVANGSGFGRIAAEVLHLGGGRAATFSPATATRLLAAGAPGDAAQLRVSNPIELPADVPAARHSAVLSVLLAAEEVDGLLSIHAPTTFAPAEELAQAMCAITREGQRNLFACWVGGDTVAEARRITAACGIPSYDVPEKAVQVFLGIVQYQRNRALMMQTPPAGPDDAAVDTARVRRLIAQAFKAGRERLVETEARQALAAYGLPVLQAPLARTHGEAAALAVAIGFPVAVKIFAAEARGSGLPAGIARGLASVEDVHRAALALRRSLRQRQPGMRVRGFGVQPMLPRPAALALFVGAVTDPVFGPVIVFGRSGAESEDPRDLALALPPLDLLLARDLVRRTQVGRQLAVIGEELEDEVCTALVGVSQLLADIDEVSELEINPLLAAKSGVLACDVRLRIVPRRRRRGTRRFAIRPYPRELETRMSWQGLPLALRPIRPEDEAAHRDFLESLKAEDARFRFFSTMRHLPHSELARYTQIDYDREMAFVAVTPGPDGSPRTLGEVRAVADPDNVRAEFAIVVRSELKGKGLGRLLMERMIAYLRDRGTQELAGETLPDNERMQNLARDCGFTIRPRFREGVVELTLPLHSRPRD
jgi:acetyltransferase